MESAIALIIVIGTALFMVGMAISIEMSSEADGSIDKVEDAKPPIDTAVLEKGSSRISQG